MIASNPDGVNDQVVSKANLNPPPPLEIAIGRSVRDQFKFLRGQNVISPRRCFAFFGKGLKAKMEARNEGKYLKTGEAEIVW
jgi:hypothetical protein